jgi:oligoribonuclease (3'-5' exoribonuclease)
MHFLWMDCETFGMNPLKNPLATVYMAVYDKDLKFLEDLELFVKPESMEGLEIEEGSIKVHGIDPDKHFNNPRTITYSEANKIISNLLNKYKIPKLKRSFRPAGQNVQFDLNYLQNTIFNQEDWSKMVHYRYIDTLVILNFLQDLDLVPADLGNLGSLVEYFDIKSGEFHDAKNDVKMTVEVYKKMKGLISGLKSANMVTGTNIDLLKVIED